MTKYLTTSISCRPALGYGIPIMIYRAQDLAEMVSDPSCGINVDKGNTITLVPRILQFAEDLERRRMSVENAFDFKATERNWLIVTERVSRLREELVG